MTSTAAPTECALLYWLPLGAGRHCVRFNGSFYEALIAAGEHRDRCDIYHAALEVFHAGDRYVIEMTPAWDRPEPDRGVVAVGPVGMAWLGRSKWFRYEVRRWRNGVIPDLKYAVNSPQILRGETGAAERILELTEAFPALTWGRDELRTGDMWNSNSLVSWLLVHSGHDIQQIALPQGGRAPGWSAGIVAARRSLIHPSLISSGSP